MCKLREVRILGAGRFFHGHSCPRESGFLNVGKRKGGAAIGVDANAQDETRVSSWVKLATSSIQVQRRCMSKGKLFVERRPEGDYAVRKPDSQRASSVAATQAEAIAQARSMEPTATVLVERVRFTKGGKPDKWRKP